MTPEEQILNIEQHLEALRVLLPTLLTSVESLCSRVEVLEVAVLDLNRRLKKLESGEKKDA